MKVCPMASAGELVDTSSNKRPLEISDDEELAVVPKKPRRRPLPPRGVDHLLVIPGHPDPMRLLEIVDPVTQTLQDVAVLIIRKCFSVQVKETHKTVLNLSLVCIRFVFHSVDNFDGG